MRLWLKLSFFLFLAFTACRVPDYKEIRNLVQVTRYLNAARFDKEFQYREHQALAGVNPKFSAAAKLRWSALQTAIWDFSSFHRAFFEVTLEQADADFWDKPLEFYDSRPGKKLVRSLDIYYEQAQTLWREYQEKDITPERRRLISELYFLGFDPALEEDIARLLNPLFTEADYKVEHGSASDPEDEDFKERVEKKLDQELRRLRLLDRTRKIQTAEFRDLAIRFSLLTDEDLILLIREQQKPENTDMAKIERIAIAESMASQIEDFLVDPPPKTATE
jgi:hypothetical protein